MDKKKQRRDDCRLTINANTTKKEAPEEDFTHSQFIVLVKASHLQKTKGRQRAECFI